MLGIDQSQKSPELSELQSKLIPEQVKELENYMERIKAEYL